MHDDTIKIQLWDRVMAQFSLRTKLILSFSVVIIVGVFLSVIVGIRVIGNTIIQQAQDKVRLDLNSAREVYHQKAEDIRDIVRLTAVRYYMRDALLQHDRRALLNELQNVMRSEGLDILSLVDNNGVTIVRANNPDLYGDKISDALVSRVISERTAFVATQIVTQERLQKEGGNLAKKARIRIIPTQKARPRTEAEETSGMMLAAAAPVVDYNDSIIGVLYGGELLNRNYEIVDSVKDIVYRGEKYNGKDIGTATIFLGDLRISTNVIDSDGNRAIGTRVSEEVYNRVIEQGIPWVGRAFVVNDWYRTAYEPIKDINGDIIGMLYVGMLEAPYIDNRSRVVFSFLAIALVSVVLLSVIAYFSTANIIRPVKELLNATDKVARGDLTHRVAIDSHDEIGQLADSFNRMIVELEKVSANYRTLTETLEARVKEKTEELVKTQNQLIQSEKLTSLGKLAAGIAHEINNPLTSILLNSHLIAERLKPDDQLDENCKLIIDETDRCSKIVRGLLEFARQRQPEKQYTAINDVIESTLLLFESQILFHNVTIKRELGDELPAIMIDANKIKQVFTNVILNALDAMSDGGILAISSRMSPDGQSLEIAFRDTGHGIPEENISKIFDPFFTTKGMKGTGLGLAISYGIIQQHDGAIDVQSEVGKGTTIIIRLPVQETQYKNERRSDA